jgi:hypothetical protein
MAVTRAVKVPFSTSLWTDSLLFSVSELTSVPAEKLPLMLSEKVPDPLPFRLDEELLARLAGHRVGVQRLLRRPYARGGLLPVRRGRARQAEGKR